MPAHAKKIAPEPQKQPADLVREWSPLLREIEPDAVLDFSWARNAITICDMRRPNALRYGDLYTAAEIANGLHKAFGDFEKRVGAFMAKG